MSVIPLTLYAREILDSRGNPTIEVEATTSHGTTIGHAPAGASTGVNEVHELRDGGPRYNGLGVRKAVFHVNSVISKQITHLPTSLKQLDTQLIKLNGSNNAIGGNTTTAVSIAVARALAIASGKPFHTWLGKPPFILPVPFLNIINGGKHAGNQLAFQEYMLAPVEAGSFSQALEHAARTYHCLKHVLKERYGPSATNVGDEGGFAPPESDVRIPLELIRQAAEEAGASKTIKLGIDAAATSFYHFNEYTVGKHRYSARKLISLYEELASTYPIASIEDPFAEDDFASFAELNQAIGKKVQIVGDDLLCTNTALVKKAVASGSCNALLLKINQAGTITQSIQAAQTASAAGWGVMVSHRSGETEDSFIADFAVGLGCGQIKAGAPARGERTAKYNQLLRLEERLGKLGKYAGKQFRRPKPSFKTNID